MTVDGGAAPIGPYVNFDLLIERRGDEYRLQVIGSSSGEEEATFPPPFSPAELELLAARLERSRGTMRRMTSPQLDLAKEMGSRLYKTALTPAIRSLLQRAIEDAEQQHAAGVRVRLHLDATPDLAALPWEFLFDPDPRVGRFVALAERTPLVRYLRLPERIRPLAVTPPIRVLVVVSNPADDHYPELDVEVEWQRMREALEQPVLAGRIALERLPRATLSALQDALGERSYHVIHYIGHGGFDEQHQDGMLVFEGERGGANEVSAERFGALIHNEHDLRLVVLNACEGGRASATDPYAGMAQTLVRMGVPAVVAMQFEISDRAATVFARQFYRNIAAGRPVDTAVTDARMAIFQQVSEVEWATPVLYMRSPDGRIFDVAADMPAIPAVRAMPPVRSATEPRVVVDTKVAEPPGDTPQARMGVHMARADRIRSLSIPLRVAVSGGIVFGALALLGGAYIVGPMFAPSAEDEISVSEIVRRTRTVPSAAVVTSIAPPTPTSAPTSASVDPTPTPNPPPTPIAAVSVIPPPVTAPPVTAPPVTAPPVTAPPVTAPPVTAPPVTAPPAPTCSPAGNPAKSGVDGFVAWGARVASGATVVADDGAGTRISYVTASDGYFQIYGLKPGANFFIEISSVGGYAYNTYPQEPACGDRVVRAVGIRANRAITVAPGSGTVPSGKNVAWTVVPSTTYYCVAVYKSDKLGNNLGNTYVTLPGQGRCQTEGWAETLATNFTLPTLASGQYYGFLVYGYDSGTRNSFIQGGPVVYLGG